MKIIITSLALLFAYAVQLFAQTSGQLSTNLIQIIEDAHFTVVEDCSLASETFRNIKLGSPLSDVIALKDTPLPRGYYWQESIREDGSVIIFNGAFLPPDKWGTNYIARIDGQTIKQYIFMHDGTSVTKIAYQLLSSVSTAPPSRHPRLKEPPYEPDGPWIMEIEQKVEQGVAGYPSQGVGSPER